MTPTGGHDVPLESASSAKREGSVRHIARGSVGAEPRSAQELPGRAATSRKKDGHSCQTNISVRYRSASGGRHPSNNGSHGRPVRASPASPAGKKRWFSLGANQEMSVRKNRRLEPQPHRSERVARARTQPALHHPALWCLRGGADDFPPASCPVQGAIAPTPARKG